MTVIRVGKSFNFDASHYLPGYDGDCARVHGHTYMFEVVVQGDINPQGMVVDFRDLDRHVKAAVLETLDHRNLNDFFTVPTVENVAVWIFHELESILPLCSVKVYEGLGKWAIVEKEES